MICAALSLAFSGCRWSVTTWSFVCWTVLAILAWFVTSWCSGVGLSGRELSWLEGVSSRTSPIRLGWRKFPTDGANAMIVGGVDTVTVTLTWAMCLLMRNPNILEKAKEELDTQVGNQRCIKESDINKLVYLQAIVKETLRLCPAAPLSAPREFTQDCTLGGYHIKKGTQLITNIWKINTNSHSWPYPLEFKPERFLTTHKDVDVRGHHFELLPFGSGRRMCPGVSFGLQMVHFTLASFLHSFEILNPSSEPVDMTGILGLTNVKATPLEVLVKPLHIFENQMPKIQLMVKPKKLAEP
ncbi:hypothetical protein Ahy_B05g076035 [Arachis hypogaea]|uniref:Cytochrome P450 n=1 Tax=Arachis hypogaea TaxID=3818 RepID=A0A444Z2H1_ARAHY|nr:hypothetical protein Ahy_B05g076035 [Arachis hypogaea]